MFLTQYVPAVFVAIVTMEPVRQTQALSIIFAIQVDVDDFHHVSFSFITGSSWVVAVLRRVL